jgi:hypothetical protein
MLLSSLCTLLVEQSQEKFKGGVGSCNAVGFWVGARVGWGATVRALVCFTLGDGPIVGTLGSSMVGNHGGSTLGDGVSVAIGFVVPWWRVGRRISHSFERKHW